ncbi:6679_t:CDS:2 [Paraglomus brasilianum]|uniref:Non-homologous end-joining factor 1 n=1 Tax=Paraglomus brasilianum TaxID=144538 RepID=A0A9N9ASK1_9GLOM|nr:6679_t:CDS:2 [Paraglomus brasilianum]
MILNRNQIQQFGSIPWTVLENVRLESELKTIFAKSQFDMVMGKYSLLLTDLCSVWFEELDMMGIKERGKEVTCGLDVEQEERLSRLIEHLKSFIQHRQSRVMYTAENKDGKFNLRAVLELDMAAIQWVFACELVQSHGPASETHVDGSTIIYEHYILPMTTLTLSYKRQTSTLERIIEDKEKEINEAVDMMKTAGLAINARKRRTAPFNANETTESEQKKTLDTLKQFQPSQVLSNPETVVFFKKVTEGLLSLPKASVTRKLTAAATATTSSLSQSSLSATAKISPVAKKSRTADIDPEV